MKIDHHHHSPVHLLAMRHPVLDEVARVLARLVCLPPTEFTMFALHGTRKMMRKLDTALAALLPPELYADAHECAMVREFIAQIGDAKVAWKRIQALRTREERAAIAERMCDTLSQYTVSGRLIDLVSLLDGLRMYKFPVDEVVRELEQCAAAWPDVVRVCSRFLHVYPKTIVARYGLAVVVNPDALDGGDVVDLVRLFVRYGFVEALAHQLDECARHAVSHHAGAPERFADAARHLDWIARQCDDEYAARCKVVAPEFNHFAPENIAGARVLAAEFRDRAIAIASETLEELLLPDMVELRALAAAHWPDAEAPVRMVVERFISQHYTDDPAIKRKSIIPVAAEPST